MERTAGVYQASVSDRHCGDVLTAARADARDMFAVHTILPISFGMIMYEGAPAFPMARKAAGLIP